MSTDRHVIRRRVPLFHILKGIEENCDAPWNARFPGMVGRVAYCESPNRTAPAQRRRAGILQDEGETVGAMAKSSLPCELELERSVKTESHTLFGDEPGGTRSIWPGRRQSQDFAF